MTEWTNKQFINRKILFALALVLAILIPEKSIIQQNTVDAVVTTATKPTKEEVIEKIKFYSHKYGVSYQWMYAGVKCETANTFDTEIQSTVRYNFSDPKRGIVKGEREKSFGLAQIHLPDHPNITLEQAQDADFALDFMAEHLSRGDVIWYCMK